MTDKMSGPERSRTNGDQNVKRRGHYCFPGCCTSVTNNSTIEIVDVAGLSGERTEKLSRHYHYNMVYCANIPRGTYLYFCSAHVELLLLDSITAFVSNFNEGVGAWSTRCHWYPIMVVD